MPCKEQRTSNPMVILLTAEIVNYYGVWCHPSCWGLGD